jgi:photosystem II stability/assembly factor-like uncharacterized protein
MTHSIRFSIAVAVLASALTLSCSESESPTAVAVNRPAFVRTNAAPTLTPQQSGTTERLQAVSPVNDQVVWASGTGGTFTVTTDGGQTWHAGVVAGAQNLEFRDVEGQSDKIAYLLAAGPGELSKIYRTEDGGQTWEKQFTNQDPNGFYDCFAFWTPRRAITMADGVNGIFPVIRTTNGHTWKNIGEKLPAAQPGEAAFAASGTCVTTFGGDRAWIVTGGAAQARVLATSDGGDTWNAYGTPIFQGTPSSGAITIDFRDRMHGILGGGELALPDSSVENVAVSSDGGKTWNLATRSPFPGSIYGLSYVNGLTQTVVITGPAGAAFSEDEGGSWTALPGLKDYWAVAFASPSAGWLVGVGGTITKISF